MKRGRPKLQADDATVQTSLRLPAKQFDALQREASHERMTLADLVRQKLDRRFSHPKNRH